MNWDLVTNNIGLIYEAIKRLGLYNEKDYYYDIGLMGLINAANTYDPDRGFKFTTLALTCIRNQILQDIRKNKTKAQRTCSLDLCVSEDNDLYLIDIIPGDLNVEEELINEEEKELLHRAISKLNYRERKFIKYYTEHQTMTQCELAKSLNISQAHVSRRMKEIINKLRILMKYYYQEVV